MYEPHGSRGGEKPKRRLHAFCRECGIDRSDDPGVARVRCQACGGFGLRFERSTTGHDAPLAQASDGELGQAYARAVERIVAAEAEIARRSVPAEPLSSYDERLRAWNEAAYELGLELFAKLYRERLDAASTARWPGSVAAGTERATVAFVDLCDSTGFMLGCSSQDLRLVLDELFLVAQDVAHDHEVSVVKYLGDGVVLLSVDPHAALEAATQLIVELGERTPMRAAAGVAHGRVLAHAGDCFGPAVNLASRLAEVAGEDEILIDLEGWPGRLPDGSERRISARGLSRDLRTCVVRAA